MSLDNGPNCKDKQYNRIDLHYDIKSEDKLFAGAVCKVDIPKILDKGKKVEEEKPN